MLSSNKKRWLLSVISATILISSSSAAFAWDDKHPRPPHKKTNINLAVASNFYGQPPSNSAITDLINEFQRENPKYTVTVTDNGATATLAANIINGNKANVDLFLAADTETPLDLYLNHFRLVTPYNTSDNSSHGSSSNWSKGSSFTPPLYLFNYAVGVLALLSNTPGVDLSCETGTCGYDPKVYSTVGIADPSLAPYGVASQSVLTGRYGLEPPLCRSTTASPPTNGNPKVHQPCYENITASLNGVLNREVPVGFVAMSAICSKGSYPTQGTSALAYFSIEAGAKPGTIVNNYNPLTQGGIAIENDRTAAEDTELAKFVEFLTDFTSPPEEDSPMMATLKKYCYNAP